MYERVNKEFLKSRFPGPQKKNKIGLIKCPEIGGSLAYEGPNVTGLSRWRLLARSCMTALVRCAAYEAKYDVKVWECSVPAPAAL